MDDIKQQVVDRLKQANNILVTVKTNPTIDLLSACLALSLLLDKLDKHATAVFSGEVPSAMEFLKPEETIEQTPNSLRDFIISLDKSKADKLRYKVEDNVVRIFITPYKSSLSQDDLEFSQGDLNVDLVVALGVHEQTELDAAVVAHGRILHDAGVISINNTPNGNLGTLNWQDTSASAVSEIIAGLVHNLGDGLLDEQIATALLTGIVAETARFSNDKTTPQTMRIAGELMAAGANQQLVANELQNDAAAVPHDATKQGGEAPDDTLRIDHPEEEVPESESKPAEPSPEPAEASTEEPAAPEAPPEPTAPQPPAEPEHEREILPMPDPSSAGQLQKPTSADSLLAGAFSEDDDAPASRSYLIDQPPAGQAQPGGDIETAPNPFAPPLTPLLNHAQPAVSPPSADVAAPAAPAVDTVAPFVASPPEPPAAAQPADDMAAPTVAPETIAPSPEPPAEAATDSLVDARQQVLDALRQGPQPLETPAAFNAHPLGEPLHPEQSPAPADEAPKSMAIEVDDEGNLHPGSSEPPAAAAAPPETMMMPLPPVVPPSMAPQAQPPAGGQGVSPNAPPPVPPPLMPPSFTQ